MAEALGQQLPALPVILGHSVLDGNDGITVDQVLIEIDQFVGTLFRFGLVFQNVFAVLEKLRGGYVQGEENVLPRGVTRLLDRLHDHLQRLLVALEVGGEPAFVTDGGIVALALEDFFQGMEDFRPHAQGLPEGIGPGGHDHELLDIHIVVGMGAAVDDIHHRQGQFPGIGTADILVQGEPGLLGCRLGAGERSPEKGVGPEVAFEVGAVEVQQLLVDARLVGGLPADKGPGDDFVDVFHGLQNPFAEIALFVAVPQFESLPLARRGSARDRRPPHGPAFEVDLYLHRRVPPRVENFPGKNIDNFTHDNPLEVWNMIPAGRPVNRSLGIERFIFGTKSSFAAIRFRMAITYSILSANWNPQITPSENRAELP